MYRQNTSSELNMCFEAKKRFPFVSHRSENTLIETKRKIGSEKKRKEAKKLN
jgi:hypothetical protein